jgi:hypothetical protein
MRLLSYAEKTFAFGRRQKCRYMYVCKYLVLKVQPDGRSRNEEPAERTIVADFAGSLVRVSHGYFFCWLYMGAVKEAEGEDMLYGKRKKEINGEGV